jgi:hypothetical protein
MLHLVAQLPNLDGVTLRHMYSGTAAVVQPQLMPFSTRMVIASNTAEVSAIDSLRLIS